MQPGTALTKAFTLSCWFNCEFKLEKIRPPHGQETVWENVNTINTKIHHPKQSNLITGTYTGTYILLQFRVFFSKALRSATAISVAVFSFFGFFALKAPDSRSIRAGSLKSPMFFAIIFLAAASLTRPPTDTLASGVAQETYKSHVVEGPLEAYLSYEFL